jgi:hypothetical protein
VHDGRLTRGKRTDRSPSQVYRAFVMRKRSPGPRVGFLARADAWQLPVGLASLPAAPPSAYRESIRALTRLPIIAEASLMGIGLSGGACANRAWRALSPLAACGLPNSQMIPTDPVLGAAVPVYDELTDAYGRVKKLLPTACGQVDPSPARAEERFGGSAHPQHPGRGCHTAHAGGYAPRPRGVGRNRQSRRSATPRSHQTGSRFAGLVTPGVAEACR